MQVSRSIKGKTNHWNCLKRIFHVYSRLYSTCERCSVRHFQAEDFSNGASIVLFLPSHSRLTEKQRDFAYNLSLTARLWIVKEWLRRLLLFYHHGHFRQKEEVMFFALMKQPHKQFYVFCVHKAVLRFLWRNLNCLKDSFKTNNKNRNSSSLISLMEKIVDCMKMYEEEEMVTFRFFFITSQGKGQFCVFFKHHDDRWIFYFHI